ncbi:MAG: hypothetical protein DRO11_05930 [Methanobacteriota archaeon]|nr:MAG: hypothetical protein DRO11_05930 [Euryarchaeota archaeon]
MLPTQLLATKTTKNTIQPKYANPNGEDVLLANELIKIYCSSIGDKKKKILEKVDEVEAFTEKQKYKLVRGLNLLLERRCKFKTGTPGNLDPKTIRKTVFEEAFKMGKPVVTKDDREKVLRCAAKKLFVTTGELEASMWADLEEEQTLVAFNPIGADELLREYNLSLTQTLLFHATNLEIFLSGNYQEVFRKIKQLGLIYTLEENLGGVFFVVDGPASVLRLTERYGVAFAKLLPVFTRAKDWWIKALVLKRQPWNNQNRETKIYRFHLDSSKAAKFFPKNIKTLDEKFDSMVEERFYKEFSSLASGWKIKREKTVLRAGRNIFIPDFTLEKDGMHLHVEIVGFWTEKYLRNKLEKLRLVGEDVLLLVDRKLCCGELEELGNVVYYHNNKIPIKKILEILKLKESEKMEKNIEKLETLCSQLEKQVVSLGWLAKMGKVDPRVVAKHLEQKSFSHTIIGGYAVSNNLISKIASSLREKEYSYREALKVLEKLLPDILVKDLPKHFEELLEKAGYTTIWRDLNPENVLVVKKSGEARL